MKQTWSILILVVIAITISSASGFQLQAGNPDGILLYTAPVDGSVKPADSFQVGMSIVLALISLIYFVSGIFIFLWAKFTSRKLPYLCIPLILSSIIVLATTVLAPLSELKDLTSVIIQ
jgi:threonine/homoserine/homoserine lactone efflux protein